jgi:phage tail protein X
MTSNYTTTQGDTWDLIAYKKMGSEFYMSDLIDANPSYAEIVIFSAGIVLTIPDVSEPVADYLPPWKRVSN